jgi:integrase/recombinase XerD
LKIPRIQLEKNFLTLKELLILKDTPINQPNIKSAFLFSCFTGLRYSDLGSLEWSNIREGKLYMRQQKTQKFINTKLPETALDILEAQKELSKSYSHNRVFDLPVNHYANEMLKIWIQMAGIDKKITFHCARHTYATMSLTYGIDIYTIKDCLGHSSVRITEEYVKLIDAKRDQEIDKLPKL